MNQRRQSEGRVSCGLRAALVVFLACGVGVIGTFVIPVVALAAPSPAALSPSQASIDFGTADMHFQQSRQESYFNNSGSPTTVQSVTVVGPDASSYSIQSGQDFCTGQTIQPGNGCQLNVLFGPSPSPGAENDAALELVDGGGTIDVPLAGTAATGTLSLNQATLDLGSQVINQGGSSQAVTVATGQDYGVRVTNVQINGSDASSFSVQGNGCQGFTMGTSNTCQINVQFQPTSAGAKQAQLEIDNDGTASPLFVSLSGLALHGPALTVDPPQANFADTRLGSSATQTLTLTNTGDAPLQLQQLFLIAGSPQVFPMVDGCSGQQLAPGAVCQVTISFIPIAPGVKDASLLVISNQSGVTTIGLSGTGVPLNPLLSGLTGPAGPTGAAGPPGPPGPAGSTPPTGKAGLVALVACKRITQAPAQRGRSKRNTVLSLACTPKTVTGPIKFTPPLTGAVLSRAHIVFATGVATRGARNLLLICARPLRAGRYTLTLRWRTARNTHTTYQTITLR